MVSLTVRKQAVYLCVIIARYFYASTSGVVYLILHISPRFIPSHRKLDGDVVPEFCIISRNVLFMSLSSMQTAVILMIVVNLGNSDWTVTRWKYYFYLTHISKFCILAFQLPRHIATLTCK